MKSVAFLTYNTVGNGLRSGWHDGPDSRRALVLQNTRMGVGGSSKPIINIGVDRRVEEIEELWRQLQEALPSLDHLVVYVGAAGSERAIVLAAELPAYKVTFVGCDCNLPIKELLIQSAGLADAGRILCECGGHWTMRKLFENFLASGELVPASATSVTL